MKLYEIDNGLQELLVEAAENSEDMTPEQTDEFLAKFEELGLDRKTKFDNTLEFIKSEEDFQANIDTEIKRLQELKAPSAKKCTRLLSYLELSMRNANQTDFRTNKHELKIKKNPASMKMSEELTAYLVKDFNIKALEESVKEAKDSLSAHKKDMKNKLKSGDGVEGAWLEQAEKLVIK